MTFKNWHAVLVVLSIFGALFILLAVANPTETTIKTEITCTTNDSQLHALDGWKKIETVDYQRIGALAGKGKAQVECKPGTLMCSVYIDGKAYPEIKSCAWYWRKV